jgi:hypothetical protein
MYTIVLYCKPLVHNYIILLFSWIVFFVYCLNVCDAKSCSDWCSFDCVVILIIERTRSAVMGASKSS